MGELSAKLKRATHIAEGSMSAFGKFTGSISKDEIVKAKHTMDDSASAEILATVSILTVLQALVVDEYLSENEYKSIVAEMCLNENTAICATKVMQIIHMQRLNGKDYFDGKEI